MFKREWNNHYTLKKIITKIRNKYYLRLMLFFVYRDSTIESANFYWNGFQIHVLYNKYTDTIAVRSTNLEGSSSVPHMNSNKE